MDRAGVVNRARERPLAAPPRRSGGSGRENR